MAESIKQRIAALAVGSDAKELRKLFDAVLADLGGTSATIIAAQYNALLADVASIRSKYDLLLADAAALRSAHDTLATKLNADTGVTDTNYAAAAAATATAAAAATAVTVTASASAAATLVA